MEDQQDAIGAKLLMIAGGGYPTKRRALESAERKAIFERDNWRCQLCGAPATDIDHITSSSSHPSNLRAVCNSCNVAEAFKNARVITRKSDPEEWARLKKLYRELSMRVVAPIALLVCDDDLTWDSLWRGILAARRTAVLVAPKVEINALKSNQISR